MCDASGVELCVVLGQRRDKILHLIYYASIALNEAQKNYTVTKQELLVVVFAFENFYSYLFGMRDHSAYQPFCLKVLDGKERCEAKIDQIGAIAARI